MSIFGHSIGGSWQSRPMTIVVDTKGYNLNILEQLLIRLSNYDQPVNVVVTPHRSQFTRTDIKTGGILTRETDVRERVLSYAANYPNIKFKIFNEFTRKALNTLVNHTIIFLNTQDLNNYTEFLEDARDEFKTNKDDITRLFFVRLGILDGKSQLSYRLNWERGVLTGDDSERNYTNPRNIKQTQELKILTSLFINDVLTGRRMTYETLTLDRGEIIKTGLQIPTLTPLQLSGIMRESGSITDLINQSLLGVGGRGTYNTEKEGLTTLVKALVKSNLHVSDVESEIYDLLSELYIKVDTINQTDLLARWSEVLLELYKIEVNGRLFVS